MNESTAVQAVQNLKDLKNNAGSEILAKNVKHCLENETR